jgi:hypothetical protein
LHASNLGIVDSTDYVRRDYGGKYSKYDDDDHDFDQSKSLLSPGVQLNPAATVHLMTPVGSGSSAF